MNELWQSLKQQWSEMRTELLVIFSPVVLVLGIVVIVRITNDIAVAELTRDPISFTDLPLYTGSISNLGVMIWSGAAAICFFGWAMVRPRSKERHVPQFLLSGGVFTTILALDDMFLLHEEILPGLGIPQNLVLGTYVLLAIGFVVRFRATILRTRYLLLVLAGASFGFSVLIDVLVGYGLIWPLFLLENGSKLFGIVSWTAYFAYASAKFILHGHSSATRSPSSA
jgi:hypothetical protein